MKTRLPTYAAITPVRNEAQYLGYTAQSMIAQSHLPSQWVIVDDGSTDGTRELAERYARDHDWITVIDSGPRGKGGYAAPVVSAFNKGRTVLRERPEITVKLDGDLFLPPHYFEWVAATFGRVPRAGIVGGVILAYDGERWLPEPESRYMVRGATKAYRTDCLDEVGGLRPAMGWDGVDEYGAVARGWEVHVLSELSVLHFRRVGEKLGWRQSRWEEGVGAHYMDYRTDFLLLRACWRMLKSYPPVLGGLTLVGGFLYSRLRRSPQVDDPQARSALREDQRRRLRLIGRRADGPARPELPDGGPAFWFARSVRAAAPDDRGEGPQQQPDVSP